MFITNDEDFDIKLGKISRDIIQNQENRKLTISNKEAHINDRFQGLGIMKYANEILENWYKHIGVNKIIIEAQNVGRLSWAKAGYDFTREKTRISFVKAVSAYAQEAVDLQGLPGIKLLLDGKVVYEITSGQETINQLDSSIKTTADLANLQSIPDLKTITHLPDKTDFTKQYSDLIQKFKFKNHRLLNNSIDILNSILYKLNHNLDSINNCLARIKNTLLYYELIEHKNNPQALVETIKSILKQLLIKKAPNFKDKKFSFGELFLLDSYSTAKYECIRHGAWHGARKIN